MAWGTWRQDRRYIARDGEHEIIVSKRTDHTGKTFTKSERRKLDKPSIEYLRTYGHGLVSDREG